MAKFRFADDLAKRDRDEDARPEIALPVYQMFDPAQPFPRQLCYMLCNIRMGGNG
jgi:hypothetical protein